MRKILSQIVLSLERHSAPPQRGHMTPMMVLLKTSLSVLIGPIAAILIYCKETGIALDLEKNGTKPHFLYMNLHFPYTNTRDKMLF